MSRRADLPFTKHNIPIYDEDWMFIQDRFGPGGLQPVGSGPILREIIHRKVMDLRAKEIHLLERKNENES